MKLLWSFCVGGAAAVLLLIPACSSTDEPARAKTTKEALGENCYSNSDCSPPEVCVDGQCGNPCTPTFACSGLECGDFDNGCGKTVKCSCKNGLTCQGSMCASTCQKMQQSEACGSQCGTTVSDGCDGWYYCGCSGGGECQNGSCCWPYITGCGPNDCGFIWTGCENLFCGVCGGGGGGGGGGGCSDDYCQDLCGGTAHCFNGACFCGT